MPSYTSYKGHAVAPVIGVDGGRILYWNKMEACYAIWNRSGGGKDRAFSIGVGRIRRTAPRFRSGGRAMTKENCQERGSAAPGFGRVVVPSPAGAIVEYGPPGLLSDHATRFMMDHIEIPGSARVAEAGCGTGVLSIFAALAGARSVTGTDIDDLALEAAAMNRHANGTPQVQFIKGNLLEPVSETLDMVLALLPHKPAPCTFDHRYYGGDDGTDLLLPVVGQAAEHLVPGGIFYLYLNSIAHVARVMDLLEQYFGVSLVAEKKRYFTREEFNGLAPGMFAHLETLRAKGISHYGEDREGLFFMARIYKGVRR